MAELQVGDALVEEMVQLGLLERHPGKLGNQVVKVSVRGQTVAGLLHRLNHNGHGAAPAPDYDPNEAHEPGLRLRTDVR